MIRPKLVHKPGNVRSPYTVRYEASGRQREKSFHTKAEAEDFRLKTEHDQRAGIFIEVTTDTMERYYQTWIGMHPVSTKTKTLYDSVYRNHVGPVLGRKPLAKVTRDDVRTLLLVTMPAKVGRPTIETAQKMLTSMIGEAVKSGKLASNPASGIKLAAAKSERAEFVHTTRADIDKLAAAMPEGFAASVYLMRYCGLRVGEALGVRHEDIKGDTLRVERQRLQEGTTGPLKARRAGDYRDIPLPAFVAQKLGKGHGDVFPPMRTDQYRQHFHDALKTAKLSACLHPHMLRHGYASQLLGAGVPIFEVSRYLGHKSIDLTSRVYGHLVPSAASRAREVLEAEMS